MNAHRLLLLAERDQLVRAIVATALIVATVLLMAVTAHAAPRQINCDRQGCHEVSPGPKEGRVAGIGRPAACRGIPWCGCWARMQVGLPKSFNLALHWLTLRHVPKQVGAWAVMRRRGGGHVGQVVAIDASGNPVLRSGNHGGRVGTGTYPARRIIAYVEP